MFIFMPATGIFHRVVISTSIDKIEEHLDNENKQNFIFQDNGHKRTTEIYVYKDVSSSNYDDVRGLFKNEMGGKILMGIIQNMEIYEV